ncbi:TonB-dependent receptor plug domain-containing protein [Kordiimonas pumila]|uniref:TonB-dependent receptor plug domain-containing protein n=1 Tax=Kordiimonas pumila TaxID=2161677 RepID=A0ABV7D7A3_9PROT|nr:TonB-dependent receptor [Kordiimonas pumila]
MSDTLKILLLASTTFTASSAIYAEAALEEVVVTASRREQNISDVGASISVMSEEALTRGQYSFALDAIQTLPGVSINQNGGFGTQATVSIRGNATDQTVVLIDGVQVNDVSAPGGGFNFGTLDPATIERIEVLKGPQSVLYGSDAIGGVVNIITKRANGDGFSGNVFGEYGAFDTFRGGATLRGGSEKLGFVLSGSAVETDGISVADEAAGNTEKDGYNSYTLRARVHAALSDLVTAEVFGSYTDSHADVDSSAFNPASGAYEPADGPDRALSEEYLVGGKLVADLLDGRFNNTVSVEYSALSRQSISAYGTYPGKGERLNLDYLGVYSFTEAWSLTAGAQHENIKLKEPADQANTVDINSVFGVVAYEEGGLSLSAGLRLDDHSDFGSSTNGQLRASYNFAEIGTRVFANWGEGFKAPSLYQLSYICTYCYPVAQTEPNVNLLPERAKSWEAGVEQTVLDGTVKFAATYFDQKTDDLIIYTSTIGYDNVDRARSKGVELSVDAALSSAVTFAANYTYASSKDRDTDLRLIRRPKHQAYAVIDWDVTDRLSTQVSATYNGNELDTGNRTNDSWIRLDLTAAYKVTDSIELYGRVNNLLDEEYQQILGYGTPGIASYFGVRANF